MLHQLIRVVFLIVEMLTTRMLLYQAAINTILVHLLNQTPFKSTHGFENIDFNH
jgi:hypothetical protein